MTRTLWTAVALASLGVAVSVYAALRTTSLSMIAFAFVGLPAIAAGMLLYGGVVLRELRQKRVL